MLEFINKLKLELTKPLPGFVAHLKMLPTKRQYFKDNPAYRESAVNIVLFEQDNEICFLLTKRPYSMARHSGEVSLPGGRKDPNDDNLWQTCIRETFEETGIVINDENYVGKLSNVFVTASKYNVLPFVTHINKPLELPQKNNEVHTFFVVDLKSFLSENNIYSAKIKLKNEELFAPYYKLYNDKVWGATAMILSELHSVVKNIY